MRKEKRILILLLLFVFLSVPVMASNKTTVKMDGKYEEVKEVPIILDGKPVYSEVPAIMQGGSTLVSIRFIGETYGAKVNWENKTKSVIIEQGDKKIVMQINSKDVYVNGEHRLIESGYTPKLVKFSSNKTSNTMVPLRFLSEVLEYEVGWDNKVKLPYVNVNNKGSKPEPKPEEKPNSKPEGKPEDKGIIKDIKVNLSSTNTPKISLEGKEKIDYTYKKVGNNIVFTVKNGGLAFKAGEKDKINVNRTPLKDIGIKNDIENNQLDLEFNLNRQSDLDIISKNNGKTVDIYFVNRITDIRTDSINGKEVLIIDKNFKSKNNLLHLKNPKRLVIDFMDSSLGIGSKEIAKNISFVKNIRVSQFSAESLYGKNDRVVRVVLDIDERMSQADLTVQEKGDKLVIIPKESIIDILDYKDNGKTGSLDISLIKKVNYSLLQDASTLTLSIPKEAIKHEKGKLDIDNSFIRDINLVKNGDKIDIRVRLKAGVEFDEKTKNQKVDSIKLGFTKKTSSNLPEEKPSGPNYKPVNPGKSTIVIDPGHGGTDPGAVRSGVNEKDITLPVSLKVEKILRDKGYNVVMTRSTDRYVSLSERANIANNVNADAFVSIHANSVKNAPNANGIETLYNTSLDKELAKCIQEEVIKATGATNRSIKHRPNLAVLRRTKMPASLIELGFITNERERKMMINNGYQNILARGIVSGIEKFLNNK